MWGAQRADSGCARRTDGHKSLVRTRLRRELHDTWIEGRCDRPELAGPNCAAGAPKFAVFSRLNTSTSSIARPPPTPATHHREIDIAVSRPPHRIARADPMVN